MANRAALLDGLQKVGMRHRPRRQEWARHLILNTHGPELTRLKAMLDDGPDYHTTFKLVGTDLQVTQCAGSAFVAVQLQAPCMNLVGLSKATRSASACCLWDGLPARCLWLCDSRCPAVTAFLSKANPFVLGCLLHLEALQWTAAVASPLDPASTPSGNADMLQKPREVTFSISEL